MHDWNVIVSVQEKHYQEAREFLKELGSVQGTDFYNVLTLKADDPFHLLEELRSRLEQDPRLRMWLGHVLPLTERFTFQSPPEFELKASQAVRQWLPLLEGKSFHIRMHRRGFKGRLSSQEEERFLDRVILDALEQSGTPAKLDFRSPDAIIAVETVGQEAGLSLWSREQLERYPFLKLD